MATSHHLALVSAEGQLIWKRPWHEAESGDWRDDSSLLTVLWVGRRRPDQWRLRNTSVLLQAVRDRIQSSVMIADVVRVQGARTVRVAVR